MATATQKRQKTGYRVALVHLSSIIDVVSGPLRLKDAKKFQNRLDPQLQGGLRAVVLSPDDSTKPTHLRAFDIQETSEIGNRAEISIRRVDFARGFPHVERFNETARAFNTGLHAALVPSAFVASNRQEPTYRVDIVQVRALPASPMARPAAPFVIEESAKSGETREVALGYAFGFNSAALTCQSDADESHSWAIVSPENAGASAEPAGPFEVCYVTDEGNGGAAFIEPSGFTFPSRGQAMGFAWKINGAECEDGLCGVYAIVRRRACVEAPTPENELVEASA